MVEVHVRDAPDTELVGRVHRTDGAKGGWTRRGVVDGAEEGVVGVREEDACREKKGRGHHD